MILPAFTQGIYGRLRLQAGADWQRYVAHPFLRQLADGTLPEPAFRRYLTQDYLFLIHFARSYALLVSKLRTLAEMRVAAASMNAIPYFRRDPRAAGDHGAAGAGTAALMAAAVGDGGPAADGGLEYE